MLLKYDPTVQNNFLADWFLKAIQTFQRLEKPHAAKQKAL